MQHYKIKIPGIDPSKDWYAHKGMTQAASYVKSEIEEKNLLEKAFNHDIV